jgi:hypothetical protein
MDVPMYIITRCGELEKNEDKICVIEAPELESAFLESGYRRHERIYKVTHQYSEYTITCPEFRHSEKEMEPVVIIPEFLIPGRPYLIEIYMYAIDIYSASPGKGQRWAAEATRRRFGLTTFSHTTLGRALKRLAERLEEAMPPHRGEEKEATSHQDGCSEKELEQKRATFPKMEVTAALRERVALFLRGRPLRAALQPNIADYHKIAREWFCEHRRLLL